MNETAASVKEVTRPDVDFEAFCAEVGGMARRTLILKHAWRRRSWGLSDQGFEDLVDAAVQQAFLKAFVQRHRYDPSQSRPQTWFIRIALSQLRDHVNKCLRYAARQHPGPPDDALARVPDRVEDEDVLRQFEVDEMLSSIPASQAQALRLHYLEGYPVLEVAERMGSTFAATQSLLQRGRASCERMLTRRIKERKNDHV